MDRAEWLKQRRAGITSTDAPAIAGVSPWKTALDVYMDKKGMLPEKQLSPEMEWGLRLEPILRQAYQDKTGQAIEATDKLYQHPQEPWLLASLDCVSADRIIELKTARSSEGWGDPGSDAIPTPYLLQVQHQMLVTGLERADVAVLIGGSDFRIYCVPRHQLLQDTLFDMERDFWRGVEAEEPPPPDWEHPRTPDLIKEMFGLDPTAEILLGDEIMKHVIDYQSLGEQVSKLQEERNICKAQILLAMQDNARGLLPDGTVVSRKPIKRAAYEVKACDYVQMYIQKPKEKKVRK